MSVQLAMLVTASVCSSLGRCPHDWMVDPSELALALKTPPLTSIRVKLAVTHPHTGTQRQAHTYCTCPLIVEAELLKGRARLMVLAGVQALVD